jgi:ABC-type multidrug transport system fused ATPase/permease subunit
MLNAALRFSPTAPPSRAVADADPRGVRRPLGAARGADAHDGAADRRQLASGMQNSVVCSEDVPFFSARDLDPARVADTYQGSDQLDALRRSASFGRMDPSTPICTRLAQRHPDPAAVRRGRSGDAARGGERLARGLTRHRHLVLAGEGHGQLATACVPTLMAQFLDGEQPERSTRRVSRGISRRHSSSGFPRDLRHDRGARAAASASAPSSRPRRLVHARDGEITGLLGANGAGKSTCLRMMYGVLTPDSGQRAHRRNRHPRRDLGARAHLGVLPHAAGLYGNLTARENIVISARCRASAGALRRALR